MANQKQTLNQVKEDAARLTRRRLEDDGFEPNYPNGYMTDMGANEEAGEEDLTPLQKARAAKAAKKAQAEEVAKAEEADVSTNKKEEGK